MCLMTDKSNTFCTLYDKLCIRIYPYIYEKYTLSGIIK